MSIEKLNRLVAKKNKGLSKKDIDEFYWGRTWKKCRASILERDGYLCRVCIKDNRPTPADTVHHIIHLRDDPGRAVDSSNLISVCFDCHNELHPEKGFGQNNTKKVSDKIQVFEVEGNPKKV